MRAPRPVYPFLAATYPVLALAARNVSQLFDWTELLEPLALSLAMAVFGWLVASVFTGDPHRRAAIAATVVVMAALHAPLERVIKQGIGRYAPALWDTSLPLGVLAGLLVAVGIGIPVVRSSHDLRGLSRYLNVTSVALFVFALVGLLRGAAAGPPSLPAPEASPSLASGHTRPDIYLIVLDKYTGARSLARHYEFDNGAFENGLRARGFAVPRAARTNYVHTFLVLAAMLNWQYLDGLAAHVGIDSRDERPGYQLIQESRTWKVLDRLGYRFVFFPTPFPATRVNAHADLQIPAPDRVMGEFRAVWLESTPLPALLGWGCALVGCVRDVLPYTPESAEMIAWKFEQLAELPKLGSPLFVFAHLTVPHEPYVFRRDCTTRPAYWPPTDSGPEESRVKAAYIEQIECVNQKLTGLVERLLRDSRTPPIIILQADHGHGRMGRRVPPVGEVSPEQVVERTDVFAAYHLPDGGSAAVYDTITPVNVFRIVFSRYFGAPLPLLPDRTFWSAWAAPYRLELIP